jgi:hypothetical protein
VVSIDLRVLRWCLIPAALLVCVTIVLWQLRAHEQRPAAPPHGVTVSSSAAVITTGAVAGRTTRAGATDSEAYIRVV